ncbi:protein kinase domain-containing protein [Sorangium sp. So ce1335]|uniref:serine/threonine-protein kinase n=1 Tax=Sorangium sp. So ce1335 TaxID=3133335 RepID=UPI003F60BBA8
MSKSFTQIGPGLVIAEKYKLVRRLGEGSMGVVWAALNLSTSREVALKLIHRPDPELRRRLQREGRNGGALRHRNVIDMYDMGETDFGEPFLVMQLLTGETLAELLQRRRRLDADVAASIGRDVARGLAAVHALHIVHRDLKPANIFLHREPDVDEPVVKVLDFGVAKNLAVNDGVRTATGGAVGSPLYMSPEQVRAEPNVDHRADIWAVGVVLFEMLTGMRPFQGDARAVFTGILTGEIPKVSRYVRRIDPGLVELVARCMARHRDERIGSAAELADLLDGYAAAGARPGVGAGAAAARGGAAVGAGGIGGLGGNGGNGGSGGGPMPPGEMPGLPGAAPVGAPLPPPLPPMGVGGMRAATPLPGEMPAAPLPPMGVGGMRAATPLPGEMPAAPLPPMGVGGMRAATPLPGEMPAAPLPPMGVGGMRAATPLPGEMPAAPLPPMGGSVRGGTPLPVEMPAGALLPPMGVGGMRAATPLPGEMPAAPLSPRAGAVLGGAQPARMPSAPGEAPLSPRGSAASEPVWNAELTQKLDFDGIQIPEAGASAPPPPTWSQDEPGKSTTAPLAPSPEASRAGQPSPWAARPTPLPTATAVQSPAPRRQEIWNRLPPRPVLAALAAGAAGLVGVVLFFALRSPAPTEGAAVPEVLPDAGTESNANAARPPEAPPPATAAPEAAAAPEPPGVDARADAGAAGAEGAAGAADSAAGAADSAAGAAPAVAEGNPPAAPAVSTAAVPPPSPQPAPAPQPAAAPVRSAVAAQGAVKPPAQPAAAPRPSQQPAARRPPADPCAGKTGFMRTSCLRDQARKKDPYAP